MTFPLVKQFPVDAQIKPLALVYVIPIGLLFPGSYETYNLYSSLGMIQAVTNRQIGLK